MMNKKNRGSLQNFPLFYALNHLLLPPKTRVITYAEYQTGHQTVSISHTPEHLLTLLNERIQ